MSLPLSRVPGYWGQLTFDVTVDDLQLVVKEVDRLKQLVGKMVSIVHTQWPIGEQVALKTTYMYEVG